MSSIANENEVLTAKPEAGVNASATAGHPAEAANKPQPVALEVVVSVNGARTVEGSDKREPFSEVTKTVLVFGNGAVIRLSSSVAPGQLLFLTNEKTKKEVVCQVVKSKNYRSVSGYVELEFTEPVAGFWGMRFPDDRIGSQSAPGPVAVSSPAAPKPAASVPAQTIAPIASKPAPPVNLVPARPESPAAPVLHMRRASDQRPVTPAPNPQNSQAPSAPQASSLPRTAELNLPAAPVQAAPLAPKSEAVPAKENSSDSLKLEAARLQEQLSSLLFAEAPRAAKLAPPIPAVDQKQVAEAAAKLFEMASKEPAPPAAKPLPSASSVPPPAKSLLESEEVKIPSWLEPLARNVSAPSSTEELIEREKARHAAATPKIDEPPVAPIPLAEPQVPEEIATELPVPSFGSRLAIEGKDSEPQQTTGSSKKGLLIAILAAVLILAAGGYWYYLQQLAAPPSGAASSSTVPAAALPASGSPGAAPQPSAATGPAASGSLAAASASSPKMPAANPAPAAALRDVRESSAVNSAVAPERNAQPAPQPKKPAFGEVHLAAPSVKHGAEALQTSEADPAISLNGGQIASNDDTLGGGLVSSNSRQPVAPAAPLPVGGDVRQAKLLSQVSPSYPSLAKSQHISGDVTVDALIDANGRVTTMKIISGPTLLHQSAMDALRQWKYLPATLDGKPVPMHLTVTLQFRLQ